MADDSLLAPEAIHALLDACREAGNTDDYLAAREALKRAPASDERYAVVRIKLALFDGTMPAEVAMQALIQLMRRDADWPGAKALYQIASTAAFQERQSSHSHSHPPPPVQRK